MSDVLLMDGWSQQSTSFRFELLNESLVYIGELPVTGTVKIDNNINRTLKRQMSNLTLPPSVIGEIDVLRARVRPVIQYSDGAEYPLGVFMFTDASVTRSNFAGGEFTHPGDNGTASMSLHDQMTLLDAASDRPIAFPPGTPITTAIDSLLALVAATSPGITWSIETSDSAIRGSDWFVKPPGSNILSTLNELSSMASMYSIYCDNFGEFIVKKVPEIDTVPVFSYNPGENVFDDTIVESTDLLNLPNRYIVINSALTDQVIYGSYDIPSNAPHSVQNRSRLVTEVIDMQGISSSQEAAAAAQARARSDASSYQWVDFDTVPDPRHDTFDLVGWDGDVYREQSWSLTLAPGGVHHHELRRVYNPDVESEVLS